MLRQEQNDLLTQTGPDTPMGRFFPAVVVAPPVAKGAAGKRLPAGTGEAAVGAPDRLPRQRRTLRVDGRVLRPSRHLALVRPQRGVRAALPVSRVEVRRHRAVHRHAVRAGRFPLRRQGQAEVVSARRARRRAVDLHGSGRQLNRRCRNGNSPPCPRRSRSRRSACRNATGCRRWKAASIRATCPSCTAAT